MVEGAAPFAWVLTRTIRWAVGCALLLAHFAAPALDAQDRSAEFELSLGAGIPGGSLTAGPRAGPVARLSVVSRESQRPYRFRLDGEYFAQGRGSRPNADALQAAGINYTVLAGPTGIAVAPYAVFGMGGMIGWNNAADSYPALLGTLRAGAGIRARVGRVRVTAEVAAVGSMRQLRAIYWPMMLGVRF